MEEYEIVLANGKRYPIELTNTKDLSLLCEYENSYIIEVNKV